MPTATASTTVSMRRLGQDLGIEAMSLYTHVRGKDDLLDGMVDVVVGEIAIDPEGPGLADDAPPAGPRRAERDAPSPLGGSHHRDPERARDRRRSATWKR